MRATGFEVKVSKKLDTGYAAYMNFLASLPPHTKEPFGIRENSNLEISMTASGMIEEGDDVILVLDLMTEAVKTLINKHLAEVRPAEKKLTSADESEGFAVEATTMEIGDI